MGQQRTAALDVVCCMPPPPLPPEHRGEEVVVVVAEEEEQEQVEEEETVVHSRLRGCDEELRRLRGGCSGRGLARAVCVLTQQNFGTTLSL